MECMVFTSSSNSRLIDIEFKEGLKVSMLKH